MILEMLLLTFTNVDIEFIEKKLVWRTYIGVEALFTIRRVELIEKKNFAEGKLNKNMNLFVVIVNSVRLCSRTIHLAQKTQMAWPLIEEVIVLTENADFADVFSKESGKMFPEIRNIHDYAIGLLDDKQIPYKLIYSLGLVEIKILKTYLQINLANRFIQSSQFVVAALIIFVQKANSSFHLCINYRDLNNLIMRNSYPPSWIIESLDR